LTAEGSTYFTKYKDVCYQHVSYLPSFLYIFFAIFVDMESEYEFSSVLSKEHPSALSIVTSASLQRQSHSPGYDDPYNTGYKD
jgi:hypothetical protein